MYTLYVDSQYYCRDESLTNILAFISDLESDQWILLFNGQRHSESPTLRPPATAVPTYRDPWSARYMLWGDEQLPPTPMWSMQYMYEPTISGETRLWSTRTT